MFLPFSVAIVNSYEYNPGPLEKHFDEVFEHVDSGNSAVRSFMLQLLQKVAKHQPQVSAILLLVMQCTQVACFPIFVVFRSGGCLLLSCFETSHFFGLARWFVMLKKQKQTLCIFNFLLLNFFWGGVCSETLFSLLLLPLARPVDP